MEKHRRQCEYCGRYYEGLGKKYCSLECYNKVPCSEERATLRANRKFRKMNKVKK